MKNKVIIVAAGIALAALVVVFMTRKDNSSVSGATKEPVVQKEGSPGRIVKKPKRISDRKAKAVGIRRKAAGTNKVAKVKRKIRVIADPYTPEERKLADNLQDASDENKLDVVRKAVEAIKKQKNPDLKIEAIDALAFFGKDALTDMMEFLRDTDKGVVDSAADNLSRALDEMDEKDNAFKAEFISNLLSIKDLCGADVTDVFMGQIECIGGDDEKLAAKTIVQLIQNAEASKAVKARAKEAYEFVTGEEYTTLEAAEKWFADKLAEEQLEDDSDDDSASDKDDDAQADAGV